MKILVINGPNMNMLGIREPQIYGSKTYSDLLRYISDYAKNIGVFVEFFQSNHEGAIIDRIQEAYGVFDGIVINPAAYTHTSIAIADALKSVSVPTVEVHISDIAHREEYRHHSYISEYAVSVICAHGFDGYNEAIKLLSDRCKL